MNNSNIQEIIEHYELETILMVPIPRILSLIKKNDIDLLMKRYKTKKIRIEKNNVQYDLLLIQNFKHKSVSNLIKKFQKKTIWPNDLKQLQNEVGKNALVIERVGNLQSLDNVSCSQELENGTIGLWSIKDFYLKS